MTRRLPILIGIAALVLLSSCSVFRPTTLQQYQRNNEAAVVVVTVVAMGMFGFFIITQTKR